MLYRAAQGGCRQAGRQTAPGSGAGSSTASRAAAVLQDGACTPHYKHTHSARHPALQLGLDRVQGGAAANNVLQPKVLEACLGESKQRGSS